MTVTGESPPCYYLDMIFSTVFFPHPIEGERECILVGTWQKNPTHTTKSNPPQKATTQMFSCTQFINKCVLNQLLSCVPGLPNLLVPHTNLTKYYSQVSVYLTRKALARSLTASLKMDIDKGVKPR